MANNSALDHLLEIEARAAAIVNDAQQEADRRIHENEEKNRVTFDERCKAQMQKHQAEVKKIIEDNKNLYQNTLDQYQNGISEIKADTQKFNSLLNEYLFNEG